MAIFNLGFDKLANGIGTAATLTLQAWSNGETPVLLDSKNSADGFSFTTAPADGSGVIDLSSNVTFTLATGETVGEVRLYSGASKLATETLTTDNAFPNGGDLIVTSFKITVT